MVEDKIEVALVELLQERKMTISTVESCTGGLISGRIVNVPGASDVFHQAVVTYSNKAKRKLVDVKKSTLKEFGAVSEQTAKEMAKGGRKMADADVAVAVTGIAGPGGGSEEKPVGLVYIAVSMKHRSWVRRYQFAGERLEVREQTVDAALRLVYDCILEQEKQE